MIRHSDQVLMLVGLVGLGFVSLGGLMRQVLVMVGLYKEPILDLFRRYGPEETVYFPAFQLSAWSALFTLMVGATITAYLPDYHDFGLLLTSLALLLAGLTLLLLRYRAVLLQSGHIELLAPRWYRQLKRRTEREERRRIGFMWLHLSPRTRLLLSGNDALFQLWADFVIMASIGHMWVHEPMELRWRN